MDKGYFQVPNYVLEIEGLSNNQKLVLISFFRTGNKGSPIYPSYKTIARRSSISVSTAKKTVKELESMHILSVRRRKTANGSDYTNLYEINLDVLYNMPVYTKEKGSTSNRSGSMPNEPVVVREINPINNHIYKEPVIKKYIHRNSTANNFSTSRPTENYDHLAVDLFTDDT